MNVILRIRDFIPSKVYNTFVIYECVSVDKYKPSTQKTLIYNHCSINFYMYIMEYSELDA